MEDTGRLWPTESIKPASHGLTEAEEAIGGLQGSTGVTLLYIFLHGVVVGLQIVAVGLSLTLLPTFETLTLIVLPAPASIWGFCLVLFCPVWLSSLGVLLFSEEETEGELILRGGEVCVGGEKLEEAERRKIVVGMDCMRKKPIFNENLKKIN